MVFKNKEELTIAAKISLNLTSLVSTYISLYKKHCNGIGINIPNETYEVFISGIDDTHLHIDLLYTKYHTREVAEYYDVDSDYFSESWASSNISGYTTEHWSTRECYSIKSPLGVFLRTKEQMESDLIDLSRRDKAEKAEKEHLAKIAEHEKALRELKGEQ